MPDAVPQVVTHKRTALIVTIVIVLVAILLIVAAVALFLLWRSNQGAPTPTPTGTLPGSETTNTISPVSTTGGPVATGITTSIPNRIDELSREQNNLGITITYTQKPSFSLKVTDVIRTYQADNKDAYAPITGSPYSVLKIFDAKGQLLLQRPFTVTTGVIAEGVGVSGGTSDVDSSIAILQVALPLNSVPQRIEIQGAGGQVFDTHPIVFDQLPFLVPAS